MIPLDASTDQRTDLELRCAWLRAHAELLWDLDPTRQLGCALRDFADLLELAEARGWFR